MPDKRDFDLVNPIVRRWQRDAAEDPEGFWAAAAQELPWFKPWDRVFDWQPPTFSWFLGGETNLAYNCLDYHVRQGHGGRAALVALNERGDRQVYTYAQLLHEVKRTAAALRGLGIASGDRVAVYMPTCAERSSSCWRACESAIHLVVFRLWRQRPRGAHAGGAKAMFAADITYRRGAEVDLMPVVEAAAAEARKARRAGARRGAQRSSTRTGALPDGMLGWQMFQGLGSGQDTSHVALESNTPAYILATSGTTATPKLAVHTHGAYQVYVHAMARWMFGLKPEDIWWSTSDIGWVVGHSYIVYAPLLIGCTTLAFEGAIDYPNIETFYRLSAENGVTGVFTSPTAIRVLMRSGAEAARLHDLSAIERVFSAGEVLNPAAWEWFQKEVFQDRIPVIDHMWQTETGGPIVGNPYGISLIPIKPGAAGVPLPGIEAAVITPEGQPCDPGEKGIFVIKRPFPGLTPQLWAEQERYGPVYWERVPGQTLYFSGDAAQIDEDGYVFFSGRADEIIKIAAHRLGTIEVESAMLRHPAVAEAGVTGRPDELRGEVIAAFCVLKNGQTPSEQMRSEIISTVRSELGPVAVIGALNFVNALPRTRSGKIMRRVLKAVTLDIDPGDISTIEDEGSVDEARAAWQAMRAEVSAD
jgi:acetyl-CoA synthetase